MRKRFWKRAVATLLLAGLCITALSGCRIQSKASGVEEKALKYYKEKYGLEDVSVVKSYKAGDNGGLFGMLGVKNIAVEMSDGNSVLCYDYSDRFSDNAQAEEILKAFKEDFFDPLLANFSYPMKIRECSPNRTGYDTFDENVFSTYFNGDIRAFMLEEHPRLANIVIALETEEREACEDQIDAFLDALDGYVGYWGYIFILSSGLRNLYGKDWFPDTKDLNVTARVHFNSEYGVSWYRQAYIEVLEGVYMTSREENFVLEEGDIVFEEIGTCAQIQQMIDDSRDEPQDGAEGNNNGSTEKKKRQNEKYAVLDDPGLPMYRLKLSQRVLDAKDGDKDLGVYILNQRADGLPLVKYEGQESPYSNIVISVCDCFKNRGTSEYIRTDYYYFFGTYRLYTLEEMTSEGSK